MSKVFDIHSQYSPAGDQPKAIEQLTDGIIKENKPHQVLLGATGTGKTFTIANVIQNSQKPTLILAHNKTLTAQLASELREFFPNNAVDYFVSYYDYYQPEAYNAKTDTYIEKDATINEEIDKFRHKATSDLLTRNDVIIVASVSCIYGLGDPGEYKNLMLELNVGQNISRDDLVSQLIKMQYERNDTNFQRGNFRILGDIIDIHPTFSENPFRLEFFGKELESIQEFDPSLGEYYDKAELLRVYPAKHAIVGEEKIKHAVERIKHDLNLREAELKANGRIVEAQRLRQRTEYDIEMLMETGYVTGIENYIHYFGDEDRSIDAPPFTLLDYFPDDYLLIVDESHITLPQVGAMYEGNRSRKQSLVDYGFRLPSAHANRPLVFSEFNDHIQNAMYISATPKAYEIQKAEGEVVEQIIRPTGLLDPKIEIRPSHHQIDDILEEIHKRKKINERALITTLTKKQAEDLSGYLSDAGIKVRYLHSDVDTIERIEILRELRLGNIDAVIWVNLLREWLDLPEVSMMAILDANKQGFLRSRDSLLQMIGRVARNSEGIVYMYADSTSDAMRAAIDETNRRRDIQIAYNQKHGITPQTIRKEVKDIAGDLQSKKKEDLKSALKEEFGEKLVEDKNKKHRDYLISKLEEKMDIAAKNLDFEKAAEIRDQIEMLQRGE